MTGSRVNPIFEFKLQTLTLVLLQKSFKLRMDTSIHKVFGEGRNPFLFLSFLLEFLSLIGKLSNIHTVKLPIIHMVKLSTFLPTNASPHRNIVKQILNDFSRKIFLFTNSLEMLLTSQPYSKIVKYIHCRSRPSWLQARIWDAFSVTYCGCRLVPVMSG